MKKVCTKCGCSKDVSEFNFRIKSQNSIHSKCRECTRVVSKSHYANNKEIYKDRARAFGKKTTHENSTKICEYLKSHPCVDCGETNLIVLQFDHVRGKKHRAISDMIRHYYSWSKIEKEIEKCDIRCANCHMKRTAKTYGWKYKTS